MPVSIAALLPVVYADALVLIGAGFAPDEIARLLEVPVESLATLLEIAAEKARTLLERASVSGSPRASSTRDPGSHR